MDINKPQKQPSFRHWKLSEDMYYHFFLILNFEKNKSPNLKKKRGYFVEMSDFISKKKKNQVQCRSHHQKKIKIIAKKYGQSNRFKLEVLLLLTFYKSYYLQRLLGPEKLIQEIKYQLDKRIEKGTNFKNIYEQYKTKVEEKVQQVILQINKLQPNLREDSESQEESETIHNTSIGQSVVKTNEEEVDKNLLSDSCLNEIEVYVNRSQIFVDDYLDQNWMMLSEWKGIALVNFDKFSKFQPTANTIQHNVLEQ